MLARELTCTCSEASERDQEGSERLGRLLGHPPACDAGTGAKGPAPKKLPSSSVQLLQDLPALQMSGPAACPLAQGTNQRCD